MMSWKKSIGSGAVCKALISSFLFLSLGGCVAVPLTILGIGAGTVATVALLEKRTLLDNLDDKSLVSRINEALVEKKGSLFTHVDVDAFEGLVMLTGSVGAPQDKVMAGNVARDTKGQLGVMNDLQVGKEGFADYSKDKWIETKLAAKLLADSNVDALNYEISVVNRHIYLLGIAKDETERGVVIAQARSIQNVTDVTSHIVLANSPERQEHLAQLREMRKSNAAQEKRKKAMKSASQGTSIPEILKKNKKISATQETFPPVSTPMQEGVTEVGQDIKSTPSIMGAPPVTETQGPILLTPVPSTTNPQG